MSGVIDESSVTIMFAVAPFSKNCCLCVVAAWSARISFTIGCNHDMPRYVATGSGIGAKCATCSGRNETGFAPEPWPPG